MIRVGELAGLVFALVLIAAAPAGADTFRATRTDDPAPGVCKRRDCSLREAILAANAHPKRDTVVVKSGKTYDLEIPNAGEDGGLTGDLDSSGRLTLEARRGARATIDAHDLDRVIEAFKPLTLRKLKIVDGQGADYGGGVHATRPLRVARSQVLGNEAIYNGGGIDVDGTLVLDRSKVAANSTGLTAASGGGVLAVDGVVDRSTLTDNVSQACGGADFSGGSPTITNSKFVGNAADLLGGGLCVHGGTDLLIADSRVASNSANDGSGGGLYLNDSAGKIFRTTIADNLSSAAGGGISAIQPDLAIVRSTISGNQATDANQGHGGGIRISEGELRLVNSTIAENDAAAAGGGIFNANTGPFAGIGQVTLAFTTIAYNDGDSDDAGGDIGGGIFQGPKAEYPDVHGSLIALNDAATEPDCAATVTSTGHNLLGVDGAGCAGFDRPTDLVEPDPMLKPLGDYGGPTETVALQPGSPAIDAGGRKGPRTDQRGVRRPQGPRYDIGAFELRP